MTDHYDEMRVPPDPSLAEALRRRLHARMAIVSRDDHEGRSHLRLDAARLEPEQHLVPVKENYVSVDSPPTSELRSRRRLAMAAAAVVAVIGVAAIAINSMNSDDDVAPAPAVQPTVAPTTVAPTTTVTTKTVSFVVEGTDIPVTFTAPADWTVAEGWSAYTEGAGVAFDNITNIYSEGCHWVLLDPPVGPTVDDLVAAWANLPDFAATAAVDITVDGYAGKQFEFTVPDYTPSECRENKYGLWDVPGTGNGGTPGYWAQGLNHHVQISVLDVDGTRLVVSANTGPSGAPQDRAALDPLLASIQIG